MLARSYHVDRLPELKEALDKIEVPGKEGSDNPEDVVHVTVFHQEDLVEAAAVNIAREAEVETVKSQRSNMQRILSALIRRGQERSMEPVRITNEELDDIIGWNLSIVKDPKHPGTYLASVEPPPDKIFKPKLIV